MKKYTKPEVEITAFDFEDITMSSLGSEASTASKNAFVAAANSNNTVVIDASGIEW